MLTPVSGSSSASITSSDKYAVFKQLSVDQTSEPSPAASGSFYISHTVQERQKFSVLHRMLQLEQTCEEEIKQVRKGGKKSSDVKRNRNSSESSDTFTIFNLLSLMSFHTLHHGTGEEMYTLHLCSPILSMQDTKHVVFFSYIIPPFSLFVQSRYWRQVQRFQTAGTTH